VLARTSQTYVSQKDKTKQRGNRARRLSPSTADAGIQAPNHLPYKEFGKVQLDPRDIFVANFRTSLPKVVSFILLVLFY